MTVCIAAICQGPEVPYVIMVTDHKMTAGDVQFEPPKPKIWNLCPGVCALIAGDIAAQSAICMQARESRPHDVAEAVDAYCRAVTDHNLANAERRVLAQYGLTMNSFLTEQARMSAGFVEQLRQQIGKVRAEIEAIICGMDDRGPQLYLVDDDGCKECNSAIGFAAVGDGARHAHLRFMFAKYTTDWPVEKALMLLYAAKKQAEVAPGVGKEEGMFYISHTDGVQPLNSRLHKELKTQYEYVEKAQKEALERADDQIMRFFDKQPGENESQQQEPPTDSQSAM